MTDIPPPNAEYPAILKGPNSTRPSPRVNEGVVYLTDRGLRITADMPRALWIKNRPI